MNYRLISLVAAVLLALGAGYFFFFAGSGAKITNYPSTGTDIIAFGDSLVAGEGASEGHDFVSLLSQLTGKPVINLGVPGNTTADGLARLGELDQYKPKVVLLLLGGNDAIRRVPKAQVFDNLGKIIVEIQKRGAVVLLIGIRGALLSDPYEKDFETLANTYHTAFVPGILDDVFGNPKLMSDEVHPNDAGNVLVAARILPVLQKLLR